jgi:hypothetical protein
MTVHPAFAAAERLAPRPECREDATREQWVRHEAATGLAAYAVIHDAIRDSDVPISNIGLLSALGSASVAAVVAMTRRWDQIAGDLWDLTPELGALNGEYVDFLARTLDAYGINPADIEPAFDAADFRSPSRPVTVEAVLAELDREPS